MSLSASQCAQDSSYYELFDQGKRNYSIDGKNKNSKSTHVVPCIQKPSSSRFSWQHIHWLLHQRNFHNRLETRADTLRTSTNFKQSQMRVQISSILWHRTCRLKVQGYVTIHVVNQLAIPAGTGAPLILVIFCNALCIIKRTKKNNSTNKVLGANCNILKSKRFIISHTGNQLLKTL